VLSAKNICGVSFLIVTAMIVSSCSVVEKHTSPETYKMLTFNDDGKKEARLATEAYTQGRFDDAAEHVNKALIDNPKNTQALIVGALTYEQMGRPNKAREYYEDIMVYGGGEATVLGSSTGLPALMTDIAKQRLRLIDMKQTKLVIEDKDGLMIFNISDEAADAQRHSAIAEALYMKEKRSPKASPESITADQVKAAEVLFSDEEQNVITRFLVMKELAENDLVTKEEFLNARNTNIGGLLPLTHEPPAYGVEKSVPSPTLVIERINALKEAVESRAITPREFSAERDIIVEALLPPHPRKRLKNKAPSRDVMNAAKDLRKLELLLDLGLITNKEKEDETKAIEGYLGVNRSEESKGSDIKKTEEKNQLMQSEAMPIAEVPTPVLTEPKTEVIESSVEVITSAPETNNPPMPKPLIPDVSSPF